MKERRAEEGGGGCGGCIPGCNIFSVLQAAALKHDAPSGVCMSLSEETNKQQGSKTLSKARMNAKRWEKIGAQGGRTGEKWPTRKIGKLQNICNCRQRRKHTHKHTFIRSKQESHENL